MAVIVAAAGGCASIPPSEHRDVRVWTHSYQMPIEGAYRVLDRQVRACLRHTTSINGIELHSSIDKAAGSATLEMFGIGWMAASPGEPDEHARTITLSAGVAGQTVVVLAATLPRNAWYLHRMAPRWIAGENTCSLGPS